MHGVRHRDAVAHCQLDAHWAGEPEVVAERQHHTRAQLGRIHLVHRHAPDLNGARRETGQPFGAHAIRR